MSRHLDVLVIESRPGAGATAVADLAAAGHRVVRCHDDGRPAFPCRGVERPGDCPVEEGAARLAELMRHYRPDVVVTYDENGFYGHPTTSRPTASRWRHWS